MHDQVHHYIEKCRKSANKVRKYLYSVAYLYFIVFCTHKIEPWGDRLRLGKAKKQGRTQALCAPRSAPAYCEANKKAGAKNRAGPSPPLPWEPYLNLHEKCRWVASLLFLRFQRPGTVKAAPGGLRFAGEYGIPYKRCGFYKVPHAHSRF